MQVEAGCAPQLRQHPHTASPVLRTVVTPVDMSTELVLGVAAGGWAEGTSHCLIRGWPLPSCGAFSYVCFCLCLRTLPCVLFQRLL